MKYKIKPCCREMIKKSVRIFVDLSKREHLIHLIDDDCVIECDMFNNGVVFSHTLQLYIGLSSLYQVEDNHESSM